MNRHACSQKFTASQILGHGQLAAARDTSASSSAAAPTAMGLSIARRRTVKLKESKWGKVRTMMTAIKAFKKAPVSADTTATAAPGETTPQDSNQQKQQPFGGGVPPAAAAAAAAAAATASSPSSPASPTSPASPPSSSASTAARPHAGDMEWWLDHENGEKAWQRAQKGNQRRAELARLQEVSEIPYVSRLRDEFHAIYRTIARRCYWSSPIFRAKLKVVVSACVFGPKLKLSL